MRTRSSGSRIAPNLPGLWLITQKDTLSLVQTYQLVVLCAQVILSHTHLGDVW
jgi:hypothetical protein